MRRVHWIDGLVGMPDDDPWCDSLILGMFQGRWWVKRVWFSTLFSQTPKSLHLSVLLVSCVASKMMILNYFWTTFFACMLPNFLVLLDGHIVCHCINRVIMFTGKRSPLDFLRLFNRMWCVRDRFLYTIN